jgi:N-acetyltransferase
VSLDGLRADLDGSLVRLEPLAAGHEDGLFAASRDPEIWRWLALAGAPPSRETLAAWLEQSLAVSAAGRECAFATVWRATGRVIGSTRFMALRPEHRGLEIGWTWLDSACWGTGANVEAKLLMMEHAFDAVGAIRVEFKTDARNERSRAALAALPADFSVIAERWPAVRANLRERLRRQAALEG